MKCGVSKEAETMPDGSTFETKEEIISLKASSIRTSIFEWYCCCGTEDGGTRRRNINKYDAEQIARHPKRTTRSQRHISGERKNPPRAIGLS